MSRQERLTALRQAVDEWSEREIKRLEDEVTFLRSVKEGVSQSGQLASTVNDQVSQLVEDEIQAYLE